jgi:hypothetical protein
MPLPSVKANKANFKIRFDTVSSARVRYGLQVMFESGRGFLLLEFYSEGDSSENDLPQKRQWFHVPLLNQSSWAGMFTVMIEDSDPANRRAAQAYGNVALRCCEQGLDVLANGGPAFGALGMQNNPVAFAGFDFDLRCFYTIYKIVENDRLVQDLGLSMGCQLSKGFDVRIFGAGDILYDSTFAKCVSLV